MSVLPNSLDDAIARGIATEDDRCDNRDCDWCHPIPMLGTIHIESFVEALADPAVQETLRRARMGRALVDEHTGSDTDDEEFILWADGEWTDVTRPSREHSLRGATLRVIPKSVRDQEVAALCALVLKWSERAQLLEAAVKNYAGHAWNDIDRMLKGE